MHSIERHTVLHSPIIRPEDWLRFVQIPPFPQQWEALGLDDSALRALEIGIMAARDQTPVISGTGGVRKLRFSVPGDGKGKRGSYRVFYLYLPEYGTVWELAVIAKGEQANLTKGDRNALAKVVDRLKRLLEQGVIR